MLLICVLLSTAICAVISTADSFSKIELLEERTRKRTENMHNDRSWKTNKYVVTINIDIM